MAESTPPKKRSVVTDNTRAFAEGVIATLEQVSCVSNDGATKLRNFLAAGDFSLPLSKEEFATLVVGTGGEERDRTAAHIVYERITTLLSNIGEERKDGPPCRKTPRTAVSEIQRAMGREYSVEGADTAPPDLLDHALAQIVEQTAEKVPRVFPLNGNEPAPFVFLLQSTGYGKTRAILRLAETRRKVVYLPWKKKDGDGLEFPKVLSSIKEMLNDATTDDRRMSLWEKILAAVEECAKKYTLEELFAAQKSGTFYTDLNDSLHEALSPTSRMKYKFRRTDETTRVHKSVTLPQKDDEGEHYCYKAATRPEKESLVVCLDEVTGLSDDIYRAYRRVAKQRGLLSIFADTATSICKVLPANDHSSSARKGKLGYFFKPLYGLETIDIDLSVEERLSGEDNNYTNLFCAGRPLWRSLFNEHKNIDNVLRIAENLLTQSKDENDDELQFLSKLDTPKGSEQRFVDHNMIAVFACRFALGRESRMAPLLVKHSLATVIDVADDRSMVFTSYPSEPILPEVSARFTKDITRRRAVLENVRSAFNNRTKLLDPPTGDVGELCAAALLGYLMDIIRFGKKHKFMSEPVPLLDLLKYFGATSEGHGELANDWEINFTHFIRPDDDPTKKHLQNMWKRRVAYYVPDGCEGLDLLVVIKHKSGGYGTLRIQVKNYCNKISAGDVRTILHKLLPKNCPPEDCDEKLSVGLLLCVGDVDERCEVVRYEDGRNIEARSSSRNLPSPDQQKQLLWLAARFPSWSSDPNVKELATTLETIARRHQKKLPDHASKRFAKYYSTS